MVWSEGEKLRMGKAAGFVSIGLILGSNFVILRCWWDDREVLQDIRNEGMVEMQSALCEMDFFFFFAFWAP